MLATARPSCFTGANGSFDGTVANDCALFVASHSRIIYANKRTISQSIISGRLTPPGVGKSPARWQMLPTTVNI